MILSFQLLYINNNIVRFSATYDVQNLMINNSSEMNTANYSVRFAENSTAKGFLLIMLYSKPSDFNRSVYVMQNKHNSSTLNQLVNASHGEYRVLAIDVESDGLVKSSKPAVNAPVQVNGDQSKNVLLFSYFSKS